MNAPQPEVQITLTLEELKALIEESVRNALRDVLSEDSDSEPDFAPEIVERLRKYQHEKPAGIPVDDVVKALGLDV